MELLSDSQPQHRKARLLLPSISCKQIDKGGGCQNHDGQQEKRAKGKYNVRPKAAIAMMNDMIIVHLPRSPRINLSSSAQACRITLAVFKLTSCARRQVRSIHQAPE